MKSVTQYKCDVCGTLYADKGACADCEKQHKIPAEIVRADHRAKGVCAGYPPHIIETGSLACLGCAESDGRCSTCGCAIIRRSVRVLIEQGEKIRELEKQNDRGADTEPRREERKDTHEQH